MLAEAPGKKIALFVVWEPVLLSDKAAPAAPPHDPRTRNYWDPQNSVSKALRATAKDPSTCLARGGDEELPVWDEVFVYSPGAKWGAASSWCDGTVVRVMSELRKQLKW
jgi:hypothetical protein